MSTGNQTTLRGLLQRHRAIVVPLIQRDYAQGRRDEEEVREEFLDSLARALLLPAGHPTLPLNLDFVYGSIDGSERGIFQPLDGQQRLTTLFLLHWYCAWQDGSWTDFEQVFVDDVLGSRMTYQVRASSAEFFDQLVRFRPTQRPDSVDAVSAVIEDQSWYFRSWRLDPTVQSVLVMLGALHARFRKHTGLFQRLLDLQSPAITFQLLDLDNFGLSDDLYIKMNARGKPLTPFETFKARYEQELATKLPELRFSSAGQTFSAADYVTRRLDTAWGDLFWSQRDAKSDSYDAALMNVIRAIALITRDPESQDFIRDVNALRLSTPTYSEFHSRNWLDENFTLTLARLLDQWSGGHGDLHTAMRVTTHFDEKAAFERFARSGGNLPYTAIVMFAAYAAFIRLSKGPVDSMACERWMRVIGNLSANTAYNRPDDFRRSVTGLAGLIPHAATIESFLADHASEVAGFSEQQIVEERLKARLLLAEPSWRPLIERAEEHPYLRGQVEFLLSFAGIVDADATDGPENWSLVDHQAFQRRFVHFLSLAEVMFSAHGLSPLPEARWERALLALGDYLLPFGRNRSFLTNAATDEGSWKRLLRGTRDRQRDLLRELWSALDPKKPLQPQIDAIIEQSVVDEPWRATLLEYPEIILYCEERRARFEGDRIYALKRTQLNGAHIELWSYAAFLRNRSRETPLRHLELDYLQTNDSAHQPSLRMRFRVSGKWMSLLAFSWDGQFVISIDVGSLLDFPPGTTLLEELQFEQIDQEMRKTIQRKDFDQWLTAFDAALAQHQEPDDTASP